VVNDREAAARFAEIGCDAAAVRARQQKKRVNGPSGESWIAA
jgi:hypothetical protein